MEKLTTARSGGLGMVAALVMTIRDAAPRRFAQSLRLVPTSQEEQQNGASNISNYRVHIPSAPKKSVGLGWRLGTIWIFEQYRCHR
jgi:hypothetical protein